jgi:two-component system chemotaxis sensor kinase CheA
MMIEDEELRTLYKAASAEHLQKIEAGLLHLEKHPEDQARLEELLRATHSLKGDSRMLGIKDAETLTHQIEEIFGSVKRGERTLSTQLYDSLYEGLDAVRKIATEAVTGEPAGISVFHVLAQLMGADSYDRLPETEEIIPESDEISFDESMANELLQLDDIHTLNEPVNSPAETVPHVSDYQIDTIRVESDKLDKLLSYAGELVVTKGQIADQLVELDKIIDLWEELSREVFNSHLASENQERLGKTASEQNVQKLYRLVEMRLEQLRISLNRLRNKSFDNTARVEIITNELESGIRSLRMLPLSTIMMLFPRTVRDLAKQQGKEVNLQIEGGEINVDKRILEQIAEPLMHILRNAVDHGIETPLERQRLGKSLTGTILLRGYRSGNTLGIEVLDDGRGLNIEAIKQAAVSRGVCSSEDLAQMSIVEIRQLIFASGFSTRTEVTEISGRGVGLDVVRTNIERLKGTIEVEFTPGKGCLFRITLNTNLTTSYVLIVQVNQNRYAIPVEFVETIMLVSPQEIFAMESSQTILLQEQSVSVAWLADLLDLKVQAPASTKAINAASKTLPCIIFRVGSERLGILVEEILEQQDIVLKPQSQLLKRVRNIFGATILGTGEVCMVLNPLDLFKSAKKVVVSVSIEEFAQQAQGKQKILLVEDSIPIRTQMRRILERAGYEVTVAEDGQDALSKLGANRFDGVVSDVQMPNLDGLALTAKIREIKEYKELPIILVTTLKSEDDRRRGVEAGANAYITKSYFDEQVLIDTLKRLV